jgi:hypothetical protein
MSHALLLAVVLLGTFSFISAVLTILVALAWACGLKRALTAPFDLLALRLLPATGALALVLTVVLPAFLAYEPVREDEVAGPVLVALAVLACAALGHGLWRGWRACAAARALLRNCGPVSSHTADSGHTIHVHTVDEPIVAVVGACRPRIVAARCVVSACSPSELRQVLAHEAAHRAARDNLKLLALLAAPDALAWTTCGTELIERWRAAAEVEADRRASGEDPARRLALASALVKVARVLAGRYHAPSVSSMSVASNEVELRVRHLLAPCAMAPPALVGRLGWYALLLPLAALPLYPLLHRLVEALVHAGL